jgi:hypothetical protein
MAETALEPKGESGVAGLVETLDRTDMKLLEKACSEGKFPLDNESDRKVAEAVVEIASTGKSRRLRLAAAKVIVAMKRTNVAIDELNAPRKVEHSGELTLTHKTYLGIETTREPGAKPQLSNGSP